ncbi:hypothetical protein KSP39_PZI009777 [Platanthera zijinensis]|uniref:Uncharacterized protein n=1 Tax=Platanthera zijinensis TaxID=2320716 RepID=A0AAP0BKN6_9ASPA
MGLTSQPDDSLHDGRSGEPTFSHLHLLHPIPPSFSPTKYEIHKKGKEGRENTAAATNRRPAAAARPPPPGRRRPAAAARPPGRRRPAAAAAARPPPPGRPAAAAARPPPAITGHLHRQPVARRPNLHHPIMARYHDRPIKGQPPTNPLQISELWLDSTHSSSIDQHPNSPAKRRHRRRSSATESSLEADRPPNQEKDLSKHGNRQSRRHHSAGSASDSSGKQPSNENFRRNRRHSKPSSIASESSVQDVPSVPRQSRHRNSKEESNATASIASAGIP